MADPDLQISGEGGGGWDGEVGGGAVIQTLR